MNTFKNDVILLLELEYGKTVQQASTVELYHAITKAAMKQVTAKWEVPVPGKKACYFSAEFLTGRLIYSNLMNLGLLNTLSELFHEHNVDVQVLEEVEDAALGNGGLGRLAACFLDSAATKEIPLNGYGIRYRYGLFKQYFENGFQKEVVDDWQRFGDPWSLRREEEKVTVRFKNQTVYAVPYDMPVIGYGAQMINTLRLWQAEPIHPFDFQLFNDQKFEMAVRERNEAEAISSVLYPNDSSLKGKKLRLKQQYFFTSASLQDMICSYKKRYGNNFSHFPDEYAVQLNDTHPVVSIPEFIRLLVTNERVTFSKALKLARQMFAYTNHTIMSEALEKWDVSLFKSVIPNVYRYVVMIDKALVKELAKMGIPEDERGEYRIIDENNQIHMASLAVFATHSVNGVAKIHTEILKNNTLKEWYALYPQRFNNKTNGITQRRWLALSNRELSGFITEKIGSGWLTDLNKLKNLERYKDDPEMIRQFAEIKQIKKRQLVEYIEGQEGIKLDPSFLFDVQVKRMHEYKRQLLNAFSIMDIYYGIKEGRIQNFQPTAFLFGGKAAPGYLRAKGIIKFINEIANQINNDPEVNDKMKVVFLSNYNVSYAEKIMPAADISEQISTAGTEASGTGNMKLMLNGAVTLGTYDGANIEIVQQAGEENNYIFGARVEELEKIKSFYDPKEIYQREERVRRVVDSLVSGELDDGGTKIFRELFDSLLIGASWHQPDAYFLLYDFLPYCEKKLQAIQDYADRFRFTQKCFLNTANAGAFSSDRTIQEYAEQIWYV
ncbi:glycogen/starch/alpha-glucan phosphorylase [Caproiciproducens galactitolivorans]|uniref:Alpha-1,4 glucan phosphorylase n=1 Tax=Caproiciproducens galactitolivorans TaxID=642589 RepID=A0A4Z0YHU1_9FIRM|nr:glycogen/starch/alpha-glucan phosphorylase [Caproiciproducens galactitolivorans]QEY34129.1 glycogen/starch/alpha-glucan phosphorylase [Caproiciproducens galactitolivorans]TGJ76452.1 maltodextrin phosphorylase [Caproiciproducens galactitolivorans]